MAEEKASFIIRSDEELLTCYKMLRTLVRQHRDTLYNDTFIQLDILSTFMSTDITCDIFSLKDNMQATVVFVRKNVASPAIKDGILENYLHEIEILIASYDKENGNGL